mmetsp:Transcript_5086/g.16810  ORF Transcript_5086/g.16810 Transcript_5086/m.16810 type:complete len:224 (+) Transcript_5086:88-759(+)
MHAHDSAITDGGMNDALASISPYVHMAILHARSNNAGAAHCSATLHTKWLVKSNRWPMTRRSRSESLSLSADPSLISYQVIRPLSKNACVKGCTLVKSANALNAKNADCASRAASADRPSGSLTILGALTTSVSRGNAKDVRTMNLRQCGHPAEPAYSMAHSGSWVKSVYDFTMRAAALKIKPATAPPNTANVKPACKAFTRKVIKPPAAVLSAALMSSATRL